MMELIKIDTDGKITARELYEFLELNASNFSKWCKVNIIENQFAEVNKEFVRLVLKDETPTGGKIERVDYKLTIDFAKKLCMVSKTPKGELARNYFIDVEKRLNQTFYIPQTLSQALLLASQQAEVIEKQEKLLEIAQPKIDFFDAVADSKDAVEMNAVAKVLAFPKMGRNNLFEFLRTQKILMNNNQPFQKFIDNGYFRVIEQKYMRKGEQCITFKTLVYNKGLDYIRKMLNRELAGI